MRSIKLMLIAAVSLLLASAPAAEEKSKKNSKPDKPSQKEAAKVAQKKIDLVVSGMT